MSDSNFIKTVRVGSDSYNVKLASAIDQKTLMLLVSPRITFNSAASATEEIDVPMIKGSLLTTPEEDFDRIAEIVLGSVVKSGGTDSITIDDFRTDMNGYFTLIAGAIKANLNDFFCWLDEKNAENRRAK